MKKVVAIILGLVFLASMTCCSAEEEPFYPGTYHVGKDFRAGGYNIHVKKTVNHSPSVWIEIFENEDKFLKDDHILMQNFSTEGYHLSVQDGMVFAIEVLFGGTLTIVNETPSWMIIND